ncbi:MAG: transposase [Bryobacteraceae bacterium]
MLLRILLEILHDWQSVFPRQRSYRRAVAQALGTLTALGRRTLSRAIWAQGHEQQDWSADYKLHARACWRTADLFQPILTRALPWCQGRYVNVAIDDTRLRKTGRRIQSAFYQYDPLSPKFRYNLMFGLRFLQVSLLVPLYRHSKASPRSLPVRFEEVPTIKRPRRNSDQVSWDAYRLVIKQQNLSQRALALLSGLRQSLDQAGARHKRLLVVGDNSFCNRALFTAALERIAVIARARRDVKLCKRASAGSRCFYGSTRFTPDQVRHDDSIVWRKTRVFYGGEWRKMRYKEVREVYWRTGCRKQVLRLLVVAPIPYRVPGRRKKGYRDPAYLLTTDLRGTARELLQAYADRWQIEVNHREEKDTLGVGQAQLRSLRSVPRQPAFVVAAYSALLLAGLLAYGTSRNHHYLPLPKWRRHADRPSCLDLITLLRKEMTENHSLLLPFGLKPVWKMLGLAAAA